MIIITFPRFICYVHRLALSYKNYQIYHFINKVEQTDASQQVQNS